MSTPHTLDNDLNAYYGEAYVCTHSREYPTSSPSLYGAGGWRHRRASLDIKLSRN